MADFITAVRIAGAVLLLFIEPLSVSFFAVYIICCASDILDGYVARRTNTASKTGEVLDSIADFTFSAVLLVIFIPLLQWEQWMLWWLGIIVLIRFSSLGVGYVKYHTLTFLHTAANKITGFVCVCFPVLYPVLGLTASMVIICGIASLSAAEELVILVLSEKLDRNVRGLLHAIRN